MNCCRCALQADAWMTFDYELRRVDVFEMPEDCGGYGGYAMCATHANRLRPPVGWSLTDERQTALTLFALSNISQRGDVAPQPNSDVA